MTDRQKCVLRDVLVATQHGGWYRAESKGERVTLASLFRMGAIERRVWRGTGANAAHEYQIKRMEFEDLGVTLGNH